MHPRPRHLLIPLIAAIALLVAPMAHADAHPRDAAPIVKVEKAQAAPVVAEAPALDAADLPPAVLELPALDIAAVFGLGVLTEREGYLPERPAGCLALYDDDVMVFYAYDVAPSAQRGLPLLC